MSDDPYTAEWRQQHGIRLKPHLDDAHHRCVIAADLFARRFLPMVLNLQRHGLGLRATAAEMNHRGYVARHGGIWTDQTVRQLLKRRHHIIGTEVFDEQPRVRFIGWSRHF
jgi:hypothetical protein